MVEAGVGPRGSVVTDLAGRGDSRLLVIWIVGVVVVLLVAGHTGSVLDVVVAVDMALRARRRGVFTSQREAGSGMIEAGIPPRRSIVASLARGWDAGLLVIWIGRAVVLRHVARCAILSIQVVIPVDMALRALQSGVRTGQRKSHQAVIKSCRLPGLGAVAGLAGLGETQGDVIGIGSLAKIREMAAHAVGRRALELAADVAGQTVQACVHAGQCETRVFQVVKLGAKPVVHAVALLAGGGEIGGHVAGARRVLVILSVTGIALRGQSLKLPGRRTFVAGSAVQRRMGPNQRKTILVLLDLRQRNHPSLNGMALLAGRAELAPVNVGVAVGAFAAHIGKNRLDMALRARDSLVHAAQRVTRLAVVELGNIADRFPSAEGVAVLAGNVQIAVRAARVGIDLQLRPPGEAGGKEQERHNQIDDNSRKQHSSPDQNCCQQNNREGNN